MNNDQAQQTNLHKSCISRVPIFNHLEDEEMNEIVKSARHVVKDRSEMLYHAGDRSNALYIVHKGKVKIYRLSEAGKEQLIRVLNPGDFTGEFAIFAASIHETSAEAIEKSEICMISQEDLLPFLTRFPSISLNILQEFANRLNDVEKQATSYVVEDVETRIALYLVEQYEQTQSLDITLPVTRKDLASYLGTTPETLSRRLTQFEQSGYIEQIGQRNIRIVDLDALKEIHV